MTTFVGVLLLVLAAILFIVGILAATKKLPGNSIIGIRVAEVRKDKETWDLAHQVAGPFWIVGAVALLFGGLIAFRAAGWAWLMVILLAIGALIAIAAGGNVGARRAAIVDVAKKMDEDTAQNQPPAPAPSLDLDAVRRAAQESDKKDD